ncbi:MAG TPA: hypothetical protein VHM48_00920 [Candidatus Limnocylindrales bacterium]|nr:hypothetical protein [Candidatus Limnocylindrales bacterium]
MGLATGGCNVIAGPPEILDGLSIGADAGCGACDAPDTSANCGACESIATLAVRHVDETWPDHPEIGTMSFHRESWYPGENGERILHTRSGSLVVAVVTFVDGTRHAASVYCGVGGCR